MNGLRLEQCGDLLTVPEYSAWARQSVQTTYKQISRAKCLVPPFAIKPRPLWRRSDLEAKLKQPDVLVKQRSARARERMQIVRPA